MKKGMLLSIILTMTFVVSAMAAPPMTAKGHKRIDFQTSGSSSTIAFGWNVADQTGLHFGGGFSSNDPGGSAESLTSWDFHAGVSRYLSGLSTNVFAPMVGGNFTISDGDIGPSGTTTFDRATSFGFRGYFGLEAYVVDNLSVGGSIGIQFTQQGDLTATPMTGPETTTPGSSSFATSSSNVMASLHW